AADMIGILMRRNNRIQLMNAASLDERHKQILADFERVLSLAPFFPALRKANDAAAINQYMLAMRRTNENGIALPYIERTDDNCSRQVVSRIAVHEQG